ncbi:glycosyltransferase family 4 protein [Candidatus Woesearchaeota archaeon]|nr:glycosyltransferase family 4 protein [Candidatus Woesearchaeota archaeon]
MNPITKNNPRTIIFISLATQKTLENSIHSSILEMLGKHFEKVIVFCRGKKYSIQKGNRRYCSGGFRDWWRYQRKVPPRTPIYINDFFVGGLFGVLLKRKKKSKLFLRAASPWVYELSSLSSVLKTMILQMTKPLVIKSCDKVIYNSKALVQHQYQHNYEVIYNGVDTTLFRPMKVPRISPKLNLIFVGNLNPEKGLEYLFRAIKPLQESVHLSIVGDGKLLAQYKKTYPFVQYYGRVEQKELPYIINQHDVLVLPTFVESFPNVILEAMACGKPVIAARVYGIPEIINNGGNGFLIQPKSTKHIAHTISRCIKESKVMACMGRKSRTLIQRKFREEDNLRSFHHSIFKESDKVNQ